jgi:predicted SAM-dependent methyltransferase
LHERRKAAGLLRSQPLLLYLGCGFAPKDGWINIDLVGASADVCWDLRTPLPFPADRADGAFLEHVLEHFALEEGLQVLVNCFRVLKPTGILRVAVPHVWRYAESYVNDPERTYIQTVRPGHATALLAFQQIFFCYGHRMAYDSETLHYVLQRVGFTAIRERQFDDTDLPNRPDIEDRRMESLYVECRKPA